MVAAVLDLARTVPARSHELTPRGRHQPPPLLYNMSSLKKFIDASRSRDPIPYLVQAISLLGNRRGRALDLGFGAGVDAVYMATSDFEVTAIDSSEEAISRAKILTEKSNFIAEQARIEDYVISPDTYTLVMAWNSIPFLQKKDAVKSLEKIQKALVPGGLCVLSIFGPEDDWTTQRPGMSFFTVEELKDVWPEMNFLKLSEEKGEGPLAAGGTKFWHKIQCIAQKKY